MKTAKRTRRTAPDARERILAVADNQLRARGPSALRLQDVAKAAGTSHPTVLHHFGSRERLVEAVVARAALTLQQDIVQALGPFVVEPDSAALLERVAETFATGGHARLLAWLVLSGYRPINTPLLRAGWEAIVRATHAQRMKTARRAPSVEDTSFAIMLSCLVVFAQALAGSELFRTAGLGDDPATARRFRRWVNDVLDHHDEHITR
jgi:AcrR family transcriptional regulator